MIKHSYFDKLLNKTSLTKFKKSLITASVVMTFVSAPVSADWKTTLEEAKGETVYFNAWGGADNVNEYIQWVKEQVDSRYQINLQHVKLADTSVAVATVVAEKVAGKHSDGSIDLIWLNGENFRAMKENELIYGPFSQNLPNYQYVDEAKSQSLTEDFGTPVEGMESPWGMSQVIFIHDSEFLEEPPKSMAALLEYAQQNPGRITYPEPPQFLGTTFLKQALYEFTDNPTLLSKPVSEVDFKTVTQPLWTFLDALHKVAWRDGSTFPTGAESMMRLLDDQEIDVALSFDVSAASVQIDKGNLPESARSYVFEQGTISNTHFVAIPYNSSSKAAAQVVANFLLSPSAQIKKQTATIWGDLTVLSYDRLDAKNQEAFNSLPRGIATLSLEELGKTLPEPHTSWVKALEKEWRSRYAK